MTGIIIIIFTLLLAYIDKPHLFKKPINRGKVFISLVLLTTAIFSAYKEISDNRDADISSKKIDSLSIVSKQQLVLIDTLRKEAKIASKEYEDSLIQFHLYNTELLAKYGLKVDTLSNKIIQIDKSIMKEVLPTLVVKFPPHFDTTQGEPTISYDVHAYNTEAFVTSNHTIIINMNGRDAVGEPIVSLGRSNQSLVIPKGDKLMNSWFIDRHKQQFNILDNFMFCIEYRYRTKSNIEQQPLRKIYLVHLQKQKVVEVDDADYRSVTKYLNEKGYWLK